MREALKVIVDSRERNSELIGRMTSLGIEVEFRTIPVGDYVVSDRICIERKTATDFENSIMNGRLFDQIDRLKESYSLPMVVIEGGGEDFRLGSRVINGTIASIYADYGMLVIRTRDAKDTAETIASIAKREQDGSAREPSLKGGARARSSCEFQEFIIGNFPGIGPKLARSLLAHFGSVKRIMTAGERELMEVEGIGKLKAEAIHKTVNSAYDRGDSADGGNTA